MTYPIPAIALALLEAVAVFFAFRAIRTARTPQGSVGWVIFLITAPYLAVPAYLFLGHSRFARYVISRRESQMVIAGVGKQRQAYGAELTPAATHTKAFQQLAEMPIVRGNAAELLVDGDATFGAIFRAIDAAERYLLVQFYIIQDDALGQALKSRLIAKARSGVSVRVLYDAVGSNGLPTAYIEELRAAGVDMRDFHSIRRAANRFQVNFRNHRKIVIADGRVGFVGGLNVGDEYMGRDAKVGRWRDTHLKLRGPAVAQLQLVFCEDWYWATEEIPDLDWDSVAQSQDMDALIVATGPGDIRETGSLYFCNAINAARDRIWIASPYFVPDIDILTSLKLAALRGVDVRVLVPDRADHLLVWLSAFAYFDEVRDAGVQIWRYSGGFLHQKVLVVDEAFASVGTMNLDNRSCRLNFEVTALVFDRRAAKQVAEMLEQDFAESALYEMRLAGLSLPRRLGAPVARLFAPLL